MLHHILFRILAVIKIPMIPSVTAQVTVTASGCGRTVVTAAAEAHVATVGGHLTVSRQGGKWQP